MIYVEDSDLLISTSLSDIILWSVDKGIIIKIISFTNKWNYILYKTSFSSIFVLSDT